MSGLFFLDRPANSGGNMWPMLAGFAADLRRGSLGNLSEGADGQARVDRLQRQQHCTRRATAFSERCRSCPCRASASVAYCDPHRATHGKFGELLPCCWRLGNSRLPDGDSGRSSANRVSPRCQMAVRWCLTTAATIGRNGRKHWEPIAPVVRRAERAMPGGSRFVVAQRSVK